MATRRNPYADPALAQAFNNIASMFAPPSGADLAGYATAASKRAEEERRLQAWREMTNPNADNTVRDRFGVAAGLYNPSQSYYTVDQNTATTQRGQDLDASTKLRQTQMQQSGETTRTMLAPVAQGATRFVPPSIAEQFGTPQQQIGVVELKPGEQSVLPDGRVLNGPAPALSMDQIKGRVFQELPANEQRAVVFGNTPIEQVIMDGKPTNVARRDAVGQSPVQAPGKTYVDSRGVPVTERPDGSRVYADGTPLPQGEKLFNVPTPTGSQQDVGMGTTANKSHAQAIRATVANADRLIADIDQTIRSNPAATGVAASVISLGQDLGQVAKEFGEKFGMTNAPITPQDMQALTQRLTGTEYNPVYRRVRAQLLELAYTNARLNNPRGEVSRFSLERELEALGLSNFTGNDQAVLATLDAARSRLRRSLGEADVLEGTARPPTADTLYSPTGQQPAQPNASQQPRTRLRFDANGNPVQ